MQSWRKVGGINRSAKNQNIRAPKTVVTGDYYITKEKEISGVQFADTTRQTTAADTETQGYWYDLSDNNENIYRVDGSVNVGNKNPTFPAPFSQNQIFDLISAASSVSYGQQKYDGSSPYQISNDGNMLVVGDYGSQKIYTYLWNDQTNVWSKTIVDNDQSTPLNPISNPMDPTSKSYNDMFFGSNMTFVKSDSPYGENSILAVSYPDQYLFIYAFVSTSRGLQWVLLPFKVGGTKYNNFFTFASNSTDLSNWGAAISIVGSGSRYFLTVGCPNSTFPSEEPAVNCGYIIYELNIDLSGESSFYTNSNIYITEKNENLQLGFSVSSFYQVNSSDNNQYTFRCAVGAPFHTQVETTTDSSSVPESWPLCGCVYVGTIDKILNGSSYLIQGPTTTVVEPEIPNNNANFGWSVSIDQKTGNYLGVGSPGITSSKIITSSQSQSDQSDELTSTTSRNLSGLKARDDTKPQLGITYSVDKYKDPLAITVSSADNNGGPSYQIFDTDNLTDGQTQIITFTAQKKQTVTGYLIGNGIPGQKGTMYYEGGIGQGYPRGGSGGNGVGPYRGSFEIEKGETFTVTFQFRGLVEWKFGKDENSKEKTFRIENSSINQNSSDNEYNEYGGLGGVGGIYKDGNNQIAGSGSNADTSTTAQKELFNVIKVNPKDSGGNFFWTGEADDPPTAFGGGGGGGQGQQGYNQYGGAAYYGKGGPYSNAGNDGNSNRNRNASGSDGVRKKNYGAGGGGAVYGGNGGRGGPGAFILINEPLDTTAPVISIPGNNPLTVAQGSSFTPPTATSDDGSIVTVKSNNVDTSKIGNYSVVYTATDKSGNTGTATLTVNVTDQTAPSPPQFVSFPSGNTENTVTIKLIDDATSWSYSEDNGSTFTAGSTAGSGTTFDLITGTYNAGKIQIKSKDKAGNESKVSQNTSTVVVNTNIPDNPTVTFPDTNSSKGLVIVTLGTNASYWAYSVDSGTTFNQGSGNQFTLGNAKYEANQIRVKNMTNTGTESSTVNNTSIITVNTDVVGNPFITWPVDDPLKYPTNKTEVKVTMGTGASSWSYSTDGSTFTSGNSSNGSFFLNEGTYEIGKIIITNQNDVNTSSSTSNSYKITIDTTPPTVTLNGPNPQYVEKGQKWVDPSVTATDPSGIKSIQLTGSVDSNTVDTYPVTYKVTDNAENVTSLIRNVIVQDTTAPVITLSGGTPTVSLQPNGQYKQTVERNTPWLQPSSSTNDGSNITVSNTNPVDNNKEGTYVYTYKAVDKSGNQSSVILTVTVIDTKGPSLTVTEPTLLDDNVTTDSTFGIQTEPGSNVMASQDAGNSFETIKLDSTGNGKFKTSVGKFNANDIVIKSTDNAINPNTTTFTSTVDFISTTSTPLVKGIFEGYYIQVTDDVYTPGFKKQSTQDPGANIYVYNNLEDPSPPPTYQVGQFFLEKQQVNSNIVYIYILPDPNDEKTKKYLVVSKTNMGDASQELESKNFIDNKSDATTFDVLSYNSFRKKTSSKFPVNFPVSKNQYWITTYINGTLAVLAVNFSTQSLQQTVFSSTKARTPNITSFNILTSPGTYTPDDCLKRGQEAQSWFIPTGFISSYDTEDDVQFGTVSLLTYKNGQYLQNPGMSNIGSNYGHLGYSIKSANNTIFAGYQDTKQINIYKYGSPGQGGMVFFQSIHNDQDDFSKYIVSDNSSLVLGSNYIQTGVGRVILYNNRTPFNFFVTGKSGVNGKFVVNKDAEINSIRVDLSGNNLIDYQYGGNLLPLSVGAQGKLSSNKLLMGVGLPKKGSIESTYYINDIIENNDSVIVYTDAWGKYNSNESSGLAICPGNYVNSAAGIRLDASGNVVVNGNLTVTGDLTVKGSETNSNDEGLGSEAPSAAASSTTNASSDTNAAAASAKAADAAKEDAEKAADEAKDAKMDAEKAAVSAKAAVQAIASAKTGSNGFDSQGVITIQNSNVGIGTDSPSEKLEVAGNIKLSGSLVTNNSIKLTQNELSYLNGVTSAIQTQINGKQATISDGDLTIANTNGLQSALDGKAPIEGPRFTGNVGIGTTTPQQKLEVNGNIQITDGNIYGAVKDNSQLFIYPNTNSEKSLSWLELRSNRCAFGGPFFQFFTNSTNESFGDLKMIIDTNGNVGIGTTTPQQKLEVAGNILTSNIFPKNSNMGFNTNDALYAYDFNFNKASSDFQCLHIHNTAGGPGCISSIGFNTYTGRSTDKKPPTQIRATDMGSFSQDLSFWTTPPGSNTNENTAIERMRIDQKGNISIGSPNGIDSINKVNTLQIYPSFVRKSGTIGYAAQTIGVNFTPPDVNGNIYQLAASGGITGASAINFCADAESGGSNSAQFSIWTSPQQQQDNVVSTAPLQQRLAVCGNGNVGIGTSTPSEKLDVNGNIKYSGSISQSSDKRIKENITDLKDSLQKVTNLRGVNYNLIDDDKKQLKAGVIAQEVDGIIPEAVDKSDENKLAVSYISFIPYLIESIKELKRENDELKEEIKKIKNDINM
jgi:hypothetical protein